jgi:predicted dehydrogenase
MRARITRRRFLQTTAATGAGYFFTASAVSATRAADSPNGTIRFAGIGVGGKGSGDIDQAGNLGTVVAICDIDEKNLGAKSQKFPSAQKFFDFRKMLDEMGKQIDAVTVSTPDHTHAPASIMAMKMKKHVYTQKPLTHTVYEARLMRETAAKMGVATQMGNQGSAANGLRRAVEAVQSGIVGPVREAHVWTNRPIWPQAPKIVARPPESPVPAHVHWDEFIGPAPMRPYADYEEKRKDRRTGEERTVRKGYYHDFAWRGWWDFGTGALGDMACHTANMAFRALNLGYPSSVVAEATDVNSETYPSSARVTFQFPARGEMVPVKFMWYEGKKNGKNVLPDAALVKGQRKRADGEFSVYFADGHWHFFNPNEKDEKKRDQVVSSGSFLVGEKAVLFSPDDYGADAYIVTEGGVEHLTGNPEKLPVNGKGDAGMKIEWVEAMKGGPPAYSNFDFAGRLTETILLGNVAIRMNGEMLEWDGPGMKFTNKSSANQHLHMEYRQGWTL